MGTSRFCERTLTHFAQLLVDQRLGLSKVAAYIKTAMADVINLKRVRKAKARTEKEKEAEANRRTHGRSKTQRALTKAEAEAAARKLDGHKRDDS